jgi:hypothetical protein
VWASKILRSFCTTLKNTAASLLHALGCSCALLLPMLSSQAQDLPDAAREAQLRAGYLLNFLKFVEWPAAGSSDPLTICFVGGAAIRDSLVVGMGTRGIGTHPLLTRALGARTPADGCQVLYVEAGAPFSDAYASGSATSSLLTVSDVQNFIHRGGIIELFAENNRLRFNVNLDNAHRAGLKISSSLLQLASHVEGNGS